MFIDGKLSYFSFTHKHIASYSSLVSVKNFMIAPNLCQIELFACKNSNHLTTKSNPVEAIYAVQYPLHFTEAIRSLLEASSREDVA